MLDGRDYRGKIRDYLDVSLYPNMSSLRVVTGLSYNQLYRLVRNEDYYKLIRNNRVKDRRLVVFDKFGFRCVGVCLNSNITPREYKEFMFRYFGHYGDYFSAYKIAIDELINIKKGKVKLGNGERLTTRRYNKVFNYTTLLRQNRGYVEGMISKNLVLQRRSSNLLKKIL